MDGLLEALEYQYGKRFQEHKLEHQNLVVTASGILEYVREDSLDFGILWDDSHSLWKKTLAFLSLLLSKANHVLVVIDIIPSERVVSPEDDLFLELTGLACENLDVDYVYCPKTKDLSRYVSSLALEKDALVLARGDDYVVHSGPRGFVDVKWLQKRGKLLICRSVCRTELAVFANIPCSMIPVFCALCDSSLSQFPGTKLFYRSIDCSSWEWQRFKSVGRFIREHKTFKAVMTTFFTFYPSDDPSMDNLLKELILHYSEDNQHINNNLIHVLSQVSTEQKVHRSLFPEILCQLTGHHEHSNKYEHWKQLSANYYAIQLKMASQSATNNTPTPSYDELENTVSLDQSCSQKNLIHWQSKSNSENPQVVEEVCACGHTSFLSLPPITNDGALLTGNGAKKLLLFRTFNCEPGVVDSVTCSTSQMLILALRTLIRITQLSPSSIALILAATLLDSSETNQLRNLRNVARHELNGFMDTLTACRLFKMLLILVSNANAVLDYPLFPAIHPCHFYCVHSVYVLWRESRTNGGGSNVPTAQFT